MYRTTDPKTGEVRYYLSNGKAVQYRNAVYGRRMGYIKPSSLRALGIERKDAYDADPNKAYKAI